MADQVLSTSFIQNVFDKISLERNMDLWLSADDAKLQERLEFLSEYEETMFKDQLFNLDKRSNLGKNPVLAKAFKMKADKAVKTKDWIQALALYNQSITFAPAEESSLMEDIKSQRAFAMDNLGHSNSKSTTLDLDHSKTIGFSKSVIIKESEDQGRFTVANKDIAPGELLAVDEPAVKMLEKEFTKSHCWHCLRSVKFFAVTPCSMCSGVVFCNEDCRKSAQDSYHRHECGLTDVLFKSDIGVWILAHRSVASKSKDYFLSKQPLDSKMQEYCKLVTHYGSDKFTAPELMKEALVCVFLTRCLQATGYFDKNIDSDPDFGLDEMKVALWLHKFMRISRFNCHAIREVNPGQSQDSAKLKTQSIGIAVNPTLAMINHSCDSNYGRVWDLDKGIVYAFATRTIKKGDEITDGYSGVFLNVPQDDRARTHSRYHFECLCIACKNSWPLKANLLSSLPSPKKNKESARLKSLIKAKDKPGQSPADKYRLLQDAVTLAHKVLTPPHLVICQLEDDFYNCLRIKYGLK